MSLIRMVLLRLQLTAIIGPIPGRPRDPCIHRQRPGGRPILTQFTASDAVTGLVLAGGQARRMGGEDKGLVSLGNRPMLSWVLERFAPQVDEVLISANRNLERYAEFGRQVVTDGMTGFLGPLAGLAAGLVTSRTPWLVMVPCDSPFLPHDLVMRFLNVATQYDSPLVCAHDGNRLQPVFSLVHTRLLADLTEYLDAGERKIDRWFDRHQWRPVVFAEHNDIFFNVNSPHDLQQVEARLLAD